MAKEPDEVLRRLDTLIQLVGVMLIEGKKQRDQIRVLAQAGMGPSQIARMLNTTQNTVNVALSTLRREGELRGGGKNMGAIEKLSKTDKTVRLAELRRVGPDGRRQR